MRAASVGCLLAAILLMVTAGQMAFAQTVDSAYRFRTIRTPHFAIHFHPEAAAMATALAEVAEDTWRRFSERPGGIVPALTHVVLVDQSESANGFATPLPRNTIVMYAAAPAPASLLNPDDWLRTLFVHEFTHIVHLDRARGWARAARTVFGRAPWTFPNMLLPLWHIEGWATFEESVPGEAGRPGRGHAGDFLAITREAARRGTLDPIDRVGGGLTDWPGGLGPYAYGLSFHEWLAGRYGAATFETLADRTSGSLPWLGSRAFRRVYGQSLGSLWRDFLADREAAGADARPAPAPSIRRLTTHGFQVAGPRHLPLACDTCPREIAYVLRAPDDRPGLHAIEPDTGVTRRLGTRFLGSTTSADTRGRLYFDQYERARNVGVYSDLYMMSRETGKVTRLTYDARLMDPDVSPSSRAMVAVRHQAPGQRDLVVIDPLADTTDALVSIRPLASESGAQFNAPRWSPDGRQIAAGLQHATGPGELVIVDAATGRQRVIAGGRDMRWATPAWRPDGRAIVAAGAAGNDPFDLYEIDVDSGVTRRLTTHAGGATWPDMSPDGKTVVFVGYSVDGFDLYEMPYPGAVAGADTTPASPRVAVSAGLTRPDGASVPTVGAGLARPENSGAPRAGQAPPLQQSAPATSADAAPAYRPWTTLLPTFWTPILTTSTEQVRAGAAISGSDVLGYHQWGASVAWPVANRVDIDDAGDNADWSASYVYARWRPRLWVAATRSTSFLPVESTTDDVSLPSTLVERTTEVGVQLPVHRLRFSQAAQVSLVQAVDTMSRADTTARRNRSGLRAAWRYSNAQFPAYGISPERGVSMGAATEFIRPSLGASGRSGTLTADVRAYLPGLARHDVVAVRFARGITWGDAAVRRLFVLGGGDASPGPGTIGSESARLLRGFPANTFAGRHVATFNADYRFPIARPQRGLGTWPAFLHSLHGAVVFDAGHTWTGDFNRQDMKTSFGAELSANLVVGFGLPVTVTGGVARGRDGAERVGDGTTAYLRVGYAF